MGVLSCGMHGSRDLTRAAIAVVVALSVVVIAMGVGSEPLRAAGEAAQLDVRTAGERGLRLTLKPLSYQADFPDSPVLADRAYPPPALRVRSLAGFVMKEVGAFRVEVESDPLTVRVKRSTGEVLQALVFAEDGTLSFRLDGAPILGMGEGGPRPERGEDWRGLPVEFDRRGRVHAMRPRWQSDAYGSRNPVPLLVGTGGWALFVSAPWGSVDLTGDDRGIYTPAPLAPPDRAPQHRGNQHDHLGKGLPPPGYAPRGMVDLFVFDAREPAGFMRDLAAVVGSAAMPPRWALGYMQSHRTLEDDAQMLEIVDTFRRKRIPIDAVIYLGTGFTPRGWNTEQPSFTFNSEVFTREPSAAIADLHERHVKVVLHMVPYDRDRLPTLHGTIPPAPEETIDESHIAAYWDPHTALMEAGVDAWWPDEGDWFNLFERLKRHQMYYQGSLAARPNIRPWSLHRNGHLGVARWGGWVWSGDTDSTWKSLEAQIAVGINHSLSLSPFWGSDIGGFFPTEELTGELYARWFQFGAFCPSFRSHGRTWWTRLPWGWGQSDRGPLESRTPPMQSAMNNPAIEPVAKQYAELRYQMLSYNYTIAEEACRTGMPMMRALWLHYPDDAKARGIGSQYLWGRDLLIAPVFEPNARSRDVYLPAGDWWYDWWTGERIAGGQTVVRPVDLTIMPIYARAGAIIPWDPVRQYTGQDVKKPLTLKIYSCADGEFTLYEDDGISLDDLQGRIRRTHFAWDRQSRALTIQPALQDPGPAPSEELALTVDLVPDGISTNVAYRGEHRIVWFP